MVRAEAVGLAIDLEQRGFLLTADHGTLRVKPAVLVTPVDAAAITRWKWHLLAIAAYEAPAC